MIPFVAIISTGRPGNIKFMNKICEPFKPAWFVNEGEGADYIQNGAGMVYQAGNNICQARNYALEVAFAQNRPCIQISDDLRNIRQIWIEDGKRKTVLVDVSFAIEVLIDETTYHKSYFGGVAINSNPLNYKGDNISLDKLVVNDLICMMPSDYRFDNDLALKEDYDMTIRQLIDGHPVVRLNNIICDFPHRDNEGGANSYRNDITENAATQKLISKWPKYVKPHPTRPGQVSLNYKAIQKRLNGNEPTDLFNF